MADDTASSRPQPVLLSQLATLGTAVLGLLVAFGMRLTDDQRNAVLGVLGALVPLVALGAAAWARTKVTPVSDPRDDLGQRLVPQRTAADNHRDRAQGPPIVAPPLPPAPQTPRKNTRPGADPLMP